MTRSWTGWPFGRHMVFALALFLLPCTTALAAPQVVDDLDRRSLAQAVARSLRYLESRPGNTRYTFAHRAIPVEKLRDTARHLQGLAESGLDEATFQRRLSQDFDLFAVSPAPGGRLLVTGYYQPVFQGSLQPGTAFQHPLYRLPPDLVVQRRAGGKPRIGRFSGGRLHPYWSRREIEAGDLLRGEELVWLRDPYDAFTLHVQGSGILRLEDGSLKGVHYAQSNGRAYTSIGKFLVQTGRMPLEQVTMDSIREYLRLHPEEVELILHQNDSFIFFDWCPPGPAVGSLNLPLTPGRAVAADQGVYPPGAVLWLRSRRPVMDNGQVIDWHPMQRLLTVQDTGSAIKGSGRLDIFWGTGEQAGLEAGQMKEAGEVGLLLLKNSVVPSTLR